MPTYSYKCTECDNAFDIQQAFTDDALTQCPVCGGRIRKVFNSIGVTFNGSGFYRNDSRSTSSSSTDAPKKDAAKKEPAASGASSGSSGTGSSGSGSSSSSSSSGASSSSSSSSATSS